MLVTKADGTKEPFSEKKLLQSIAHAGIPESMHRKVIQHVQSHLYEGIPTYEIYKHIGEFLEKSSQPFHKTRYSLKQAIMELGPTGFPFEDYISKLLNDEGYTTEVRTILQGNCITHEIDVIAQKNTVIPTKIMIEAKYHNAVGIKTDVHVPMYTKARFDDIKERYKFSEVWLVTNTKATIDAIAYANCVGMKIMSWSYPEGGSLRELVEKYLLYPITALTTLPQGIKQQMLEKGIVLCKDICQRHDLLNEFALDNHTKEIVIQEVSFLCHS